MTERAGLLKAKEAAAYLGVSVRTLRRLQLPCYALSSRILRWSPVDLDVYLASCRKVPLARAPVDLTRAASGDPVIRLADILGDGRRGRIKRKAT